MKHIFLVGACYVDTILSVPYFPEEDSKLRAQSLAVRRGGNCPNTLEVLHQLLLHSPPKTGTALSDVRTHLISCLPDVSSAATARIKASFGTRGTQQQEEEGEEHGAEAYGELVEGCFSTCIYRAGVEEPASSFIVRSLATGSRTIVNYNGLEEMSLGEFRTIADEFEGAESSWWHFEGRIPETTLECIQHLRSFLPNAKISVEVEKPGREGLTSLAKAADVIFYSRSWAEAQGHSNAAACLENETPSTTSLALCTWGSQGATAFTPSDRRLVKCPVERPSDGTHIEVVDTVGAGDTFIAGLLYGLICHSTDWDTDGSLKFAVNLATLKVQREGFAGLGRDVRERL